MRRKKHLDRAGGGGGGTELFICFTSRPSASGLRPSASSKAFSPGRSGSSAGGSGNGAAGAGGAADAAPAALLRPSLSRRLRNSGSLKGGQSPMFPPGTASGGRRGRGGMEPAEPSSPKVTCIGQVRVKGGKRKPKHASSAAALRSRSRRGSEASFRRGADDRDGAGALHPGAKNQGWVYQIPVNICEALKTFGSCGGRSLCSPSRERGGGAPRSGAAGDKKRRRAPAGGSWLCGAAVARCLLAIQEEEDDVGKGSAVGPADEARESQVGLVMQGWDVEDEEGEEDETRVVVGAVEVEKEDEILLVGGKEEEGRVSVCIPPRNALLLMRCRSDPVRMAELATRFWGSPAAATASVGQVDNEGDGGVQEEEKEEGEANGEKECAEEARNSTVSADGEACRERGGVVEDDGGEAGDAGQAGSEDESSNHKDIGEEENDGGCRGDAEEKDEPVEAQIVRKDVGLEVEAAKSESQAPAMVEAVAGTKESADVPRMEEEEVKGRRSLSSCSPSTALKEDRKLRRLGSTRRRVSTSSKASSSSDRVDRRHSFSAEMEARRSSFSSLKDSRRASFSIDRDGRRWSFTIEQEHLVAEPKVLTASRKGKKNSSEAESEKDCPVLVAAPNSVEEAQECNEDGKEEATNDDGEEEGTTAQCVEIKTEAEKVETGVDEEKVVEVKQEQRKKSGELPDCLLMMMCEPKLSMEVSKETWVCSTDFVHWKSHQGQNRRQQNAAATDSNAAASEETKDDSSNAPDTSVAKDTEESIAPASVNPASMQPHAAPKPQPKPAVEQKLKLELPKVAAGVAVYAPLVLKRCKSEPLRSSARLAPDTCFWKEDRHRPLKATGIGF
ncbi:hypothetical protein CFC21_009070 [Triticum aestivum]|uniref:Chloroplast protein HCF243 n=2 Tax=Triticum aestivum TaxID=4565 RepID=A0A9R1DHL4_WHEAT|nr:uncharacterized abhydrolase domain-containing protein DDB_G0269086-like [Triticum aestivum]KAF6992039.1 hypothetical protein CFC21_009070 [Triticum aestivum]